MNNVYCANFIKVKENIMKRIIKTTYVGEEKVVTKFLWIPVVVERCNEFEVRWLETATILYRYVCGELCNHWSPIKFIENKN